MEKKDWPPLLFLRIIFPQLSCLFLPGAAGEGIFHNPVLPCPVDAVAQSALFLRAVCENVAQVGVSRFAADFRAPHAVGEILFFLNQFFFDGAGEAGPAAA